MPQPSNATIVDQIPDDTPAHHYQQEENTITSQQSTGDSISTLSPTIPQSPFTPDPNSVSSDNHDESRPADTHHSARNSLQNTTSTPPCSSCQLLL
jgi:hypothetical protein